MATWTASANRPCRIIPCIRISATSAIHLASGGVCDERLGLEQQGFVVRPFRRRAGNRVAPGQTDQDLRVGQHVGRSVHQRLGLAVRHQRLLRMADDRPQLSTAAAPSPSQVVRRKQLERPVPGGGHVDLAPEPGEHLREFEQQLTIGRSQRRGTAQEVGRLHERTNRAGMRSRLLPRCRRSHVPSGQCEMVSDLRAVRLVQRHRKTPVQDAGIWEIGIDRLAQQAVPVSQPILPANQQPGADRCFLGRAEVDDSQVVQLRPP